MPYKDPEKQKASKKKWRKDNPEKAKAYMAGYYQENKEAMLASSKQWKLDNPEKVKEYHLASICKKLGLTTDDYWRMNEEQDGKCAICGQECASGKRLAIDHCHATLQVRQLLCFNCNTAIGKLQDDPNIVRRAADYIERHCQVRLDIAS